MKPSTASDRRKRLRSLLATEKPLVVPGVYDALSGLLVQRAAFQAAHLGSYSVASAMGLPDIGLLGLNELAAATEKVANAIDLPLFADAEDGFHEPADIWRTVHAFESAGAAAIHIEDHVSGKHARGPRRVMPLPAFVARIEAAIGARRDPDLLLIARTDVAWATGDLDETAQRVHALAEAGADAVMITGVALSQLRTLRAGHAVKLVILSAYDASMQEEGAAGADVVIYHDFCMAAAMGGVAERLEAFKAALASRSAIARVDSLPQLRTLVGYDDA